ncbi:MAG: hypothetical protein JWL86_4949 [Rhizobium sp.]|nr:hypothetical protein [Rhizobium sp.]
MASMGTLAIILLGANFSRRSAMAMLGLLFFPYFWYLAPLLYTDATAVFFAVAGFALGLRGRNWAAGALFVLGIACRQYIVAFPLAIVAFRYIQARSLRAAVARETFPLLLSIFSLLIWYRFFGGAGPKVAIDAQAIRAGHIYPNHAVYFLTTVGVYFVVVEAIIFRSLKASVSATQCVIAVSVAVLFLLFPPLVNVNTVTDTMGYLDKAVRLLLPDSMRMIVFLMLAIATCLRFSPFSLAGLVVYANAALMLFAHVAWDKYALPAIAVLWLLSSFGDLRDVRTKHHDA